MLREGMTTQLAHKATQQQAMALERGGGRGEEVSEDVGELLMLWLLHQNRLGDAQQVQVFVFVFFGLCW